MIYYSETAKAIELIGKYLKGKIIDIGCGGGKVTPDAIGVDGRKLDGVDIVLENEFDIYRLDKYGDELQSADVLYSSHTLEHLRDDYGALLNWVLLLKVGGYLILYLPDGDKYDNFENLEHMRNYKYNDFKMFFERCFCGQGKNYKGENFRKRFEIIESRQDFRDDCYSFFIVAQKVDL